MQIHSSSKTTWTNIVCTNSVTSTLLMRKILWISPPKTPNSHYWNKYDLAFKCTGNYILLTKTCISMHQLDESFHEDILFVCNVIWQCLYVCVRVYSLTFKRYFSPECLRKKNVSSFISKKHPLNISNFTETEYLIKAEKLLITEMIWVGI